MLTPPSEPRSRFDASHQNVTRIIKNHSALPGIEGYRRAPWVEPDSIRPNVVRFNLQMKIHRAFPLLLLVGFVTETFAAESPSSPEPRWWKGNLHTHSLWSDGDGFPEMIANWYRESGYHFLAFSDHNILSQGQRWLSLEAVAARAKGEPWRGGSQTPRDAYADYLKRFGPHWVETRLGSEPGSTEVRLKPFDEYRSLFDEPGRFLLIESEEITHQARNKRAVHMNATNVIELIKPRDGDTVRDVMENHIAAVEESAARAGREIMVHVNHPNYKWGVTAEDLAAVVREQFFEVWNGVATDNDPGDVNHPSTDEIWDIANTLRIVGFQAAPLFGLATDDSHDYQDSKTRALPGRAWIMVRARHLTPESLIRALRAGDFYSTSGVVLDEVRFDAATRTVSLVIRPDGNETFVTRFIGTRRGVKIEGKPRLDQDGRVVETTLDYRTSQGPQIGEILGETQGLNPVYTLTGNELYVRAVVTSSGTPAVPSVEAEFKRAWTQPFGWTAPPAEAQAAKK